MADGHLNLHLRKDSESEIFINHLSKLMPSNMIQNRSYATILLLRWTI